MTALPSKSAISGSPSRATANSGFGQLWEALAERLFGGGAGSATAAEKATSRGVLEAARDIHPIAAAVAANALTITLNPTALDFRNGALGNGAPTTRTVAAPITLTISSGSTLGTGNGVLGRLAVLAIDNAGTVELAVVNAAGGVNLDESGVITTVAEGGAGAADSVSTVYSQTARSNVPYRLLGFLESTQAAAGTWATAPSLVSGGASPLAMWLSGYGQTRQDVTGSRSIGVTYTNTTGRRIKVWACVAGANTGGACGAGINVDGALIASVTTSESNGASWGPLVQALFAEVPPGSTYAVANTTLTNSLSSWREYR